MTTIRESGLPNLVYRGKVRDTHDLDDKLFLMVVTDRISAFDVVDRHHARCPPDFPPD